MILKTCKFFAGFAMLMMLIFTACSKEDTSPYDSIEDFFEKQQDLQTFTVNPANDIFFTGKQGTKVSIPAESIRDASGNLVTGDVTLEFVEIFTKSEMILNNKPTNLSDGGILVSAGEFMLNLKKGEDLLQPSNGVTFDFPVRENVSNVEQMSVWRAAENDLEGLFSWDARSTDSLGLVQFNVVTQQMNMSTFGWDSFTWLNCDYRFITSDPLTRLNVKPVNLTADLSNVAASIAFRRINSVIGMWSNSSGFQSIEIPIGEEVDVVMVGVGEEGIFLAVESVILSEDLELELEMEKVTEEELKEKLMELD